MTTPNNAAAAMDRLEQKWREEAAAEWTHCQNKELSEWVRDRCYGQHNRLLSCADELAALRATLAQPDALASQPSGEAQEGPEFHDGCSLDGFVGGCERMGCHPSADAPWVAVDEWLPIESAPAGVPILVRYVNSAGKERVIKARFIQRFTEESSGDCDEGVDEYDEANDRYTYCEGWREMIDNWDDFAFVAVSEGSPTHWHKIPSTAALAPKPEGGHG